VVRDPTGDLSIHDVPQVVPVQDNIIAQVADRSAASAQM
jgi:hypothetical protein